MCAYVVGVGGGWEVSLSDKTLSHTRGFWDIQGRLPAPSIPLAPISWSEIPPFEHLQAEPHIP